MAQLKGYLKWPYLLGLAKIDPTVMAKVLVWVFLLSIKCTKLLY